jgi:putative acetyltransferase
MNLQICLADLFDTEKLIELQSNSLRLLSTDYEPKEIEDLVISEAKARLTSKEIVALAFYKDEFVGFACLDIKNSLISGLYVHPNFIRQGIGTHLLNFIDKIAQASGCKVLKVYSSLTAVNFYKTQGFEVITELIKQARFFTKLASYFKFFTKKHYIFIPVVYLERKIIFEPNTVINSLRQ